MPPRRGWEIYFGWMILQICRAAGAGEKRWRATALQDAGARNDDAGQTRSVLECASPLALWAGGTKTGVTIL